VADSVKAVLDLKGLPKGERMMLPFVSGLPPFSSVISLDSVRVKF
jgi:hypothetical protein